MSYSNKIYSLLLNSGRRRRESTPWKVRLNYSLLANSPGGGDYLGASPGTLLKETMLAEGPDTWASFVAPFFRSWDGKGKSKARIGSLVIVGTVRFFEGKLSDLAHGLSWGIIVAL